MPGTSNKSNKSRGGKVGSNSEGLKKYHTCCRENRCGKTDKKHLATVKKKFQKEQKSKKEDLAKGQTNAKKRLEERLQKRKKGKMDIKKPAQKSKVQTGGGNVRVVVRPPRRPPRPRPRPRPARAAIVCNIM
jgi:hypothetical protein